MHWRKSQVVPSWLFVCITWCVLKSAVFWTLPYSIYLSHVFNTNWCFGYLVFFLSKPFMWPNCLVQNQSRQDRALSDMKIARGEELETAVSPCPLPPVWVSSSTCPIQHVLLPHVHFFQILFWKSIYWRWMNVQAFKWIKQGYGALMVCTFDSQLWGWGFKSHVWPVCMFSPVLPQSKDVL